MSNFLIIAGVFLILVGVLLKFKFLLPGDILIKKEGFIFYFPIASSLVVSIILTLIFWIISKIK